MAKGKHRNRTGQRDLSTRSLTVPVAAPPIKPVTLALIEDRRTFHPARYLRGAQTLGGKFNAEVVARPAKLTRSVPAHIGFRAPARVVLCVRRRQRKEVLFALRKTRKGAGARRRRRNIWSGVRC